MKWLLDLRPESMESYFQIRQMITVRVTDKKTDRLCRDTVSTKLYNRSTKALEAIKRIKGNGTGKSVVQIISPNQGVQENTRKQYRMYGS